MASGTAFLVAGSLTNNDSNERQDKLRNQGAFSRLDGTRLSALLSDWHESWPTSFDLAIDRQKELHQTLQAFCRDAAKDTKAFGNRLRIMACEWWLSKSEAQRTCLQLIAVQAGIFALWQLRPLYPFMKRHFLSDPLSGRAYTDLTSTFSHQSLLHFGFNSIAFYSIGSAAHEWLWRQETHGDLKASTSKYEFIAFFVAGGLAASLASQSFSLLVKIPRLLSSSRPLVRSDLLPSLGASGAIWSCLSISALVTFGDSIPRCVRFLDHIALGTDTYWRWRVGVSHSVGTALSRISAGMAVLDLIGLIRGWRLFDHAAHLGGATFGLLYFLCGPQAFEALRKLLPGAEALAPTE